MSRRPRLHAARAFVCAAALVLGGCHGNAHPMVDATNTPDPAGPELTDAYLTDDRDNAISRTTFPADTKPIYLSFSAKNSDKIPVRAVWLADSPSGGTKAMLGEQQVELTGGAVHGMVSEQPFGSAWKPGPYQVDVYFGDTLVHSEHFKVVVMSDELNDSIGDMLPSPSPAPAGIASPLTPMITPIPTATPFVAAAPAAPEDGQGHVTIGVGDRFELHTSDVCHNVTYTININGRRQGSYAVPGVTNDISMDFAQGMNTLELRWDAPDTVRECQLAIALNHNHKLRTLTQVHVFRLSPAHGTETLKIMVK